MIELSLVASAALSRPASTAVTPVNESFLTRMLPSSLQAIDPARSNPNRKRAREHNSQADDDDRGDCDPDAGNPGQDTGLPKGESGADDQNEVADEIEMDE